MLRDQTKALLKKYGIKLKKEQGQSHVVDEGILERMIDYANLKSSDVILEIGSGLGNLTEFLVREAGKVVVVEKDERLASILRERLDRRENLEIIQGDVLEIDFPNFDKVVSNLPYSISSPITFRLLEKEFDLGILMYQKEFAERMVAEPGSPNYSRLSVGVFYRGDAEILEEVTPEKFIPEPEVSSTIVKFKPRKPPFQVLSEEKFYATVRAAFQHRRQKIRNSFLHSFEEIFPGTELSDDQKRTIIDESIPDEISGKRAGKVTTEEFGQISDLLVEKKRELVD